MNEKLFSSIEIKETIDLNKLKPGMPIKIKQPAGKVYETGSAADADYGGIELSEIWHDTVITEVNTDTNEPYIETEQYVHVHSYIFNRFHTDEIRLENGILIADPK
ncbi:hypothetical protein GF391_01960 [Candidatus Uhrbacteria bacterium]|nr:hypothetical protein [Candidatus Uhrbacteria bacterium]